MKLIIAFLSAFIFLFQAPDLESVRAKYPSAHTTKQNADRFAKLVEKGSGSTMAGYKAAAKIIQAKFAKGEGRKKIISAGATSLENAVKADPDNAELRLIRLSIQESLPKFIKYNGHIAADKAFLLKNYTEQNSSLKSHIRKFAATSKSFTAAEKQKLK